MKKALITTAIFFVTLIIKAQSPTFQWAKGMGGSTNSDRAKSVKVDGSGNVYTTGSFDGTVDFDPGPGTYTLTSFGLNDVFVSKLDALGNFIWAIQMGGTSSENGISIDVDGFSNVYITGDFSGISDFDPSVSVYTLTSFGGSDAFVLKLNSSGALIWVKQLGSSTANDNGYSIDVDNSGNIYSTGAFGGNADFDPSPSTFTMSSFGSNDIYVSKLDNNGNYVWAMQMGGAASDISRSIFVDASSNVYTTGSFSGNGDYDPGLGVLTLTNSGSNDIFISKLNSSGNFLWANKIGDIGGDVAFGIFVDTFNDAYVAGSFQGIVDFDPGIGSYTVSASGINSDIFVVKLNASGNFIWAKAMGNSGSSDAAEAMCVDNLSNVYTTGVFTGNADFDPGPGTFTLSAGAGFGTYISKLDANGNFVWAQSLGNNGGGRGQGIITDASFNVYTTGYYAGVGDFDPGVGTFTLSSNAGTYDIFVHKMSQCVSPASPTNITLINNQNICSNTTTTLSATSTGTINWFATPTSTTVLGTGANYITPTLAAGTYTYYAEATSCTVNPIRTTITITVNSSPTIAVNGGSICSGNSFTINPSGANTYTFQGGSAIVNPTSNNSYTVLGTNSFGCISQSFATSNITVNALPTVLILPSTNPICAGATSTLVCGGSSNSYTWSAGPINTNITINPTVTTTYSVVGVDVNGCQNSAAKTITVNALPTVSASSNNSLICVGQSATLTASGAITYSWSSGGSASNEVVTPTVTSNYTVTGTDANGCKNNFVITQNVSLCTDIKQSNLLNESILIYPNPASTILNISIADMDTLLQVEIYNTLGELVVTNEAKAELMQIKLDHIESGVYTIKIKDGNQIIKTQKLIKQ